MFAVAVKEPPPYGKRKGWTPRTPDVRFKKNPMIIFFLDYVW